MKYLPYTEAASLGNGFDVQDIEVDGSKVSLTLLPNDYTQVKAIMTNDENYTFTTYGVHHKANIVSFKPYSEIGDPYAYEVKFDKAVRFKNYEEITLQGFTNPIYNIPYKIIKNIKSNIIILYPSEDLPFTQVTTGLGYYPVSYTEGFNGLFVFEDEGSNKISYQIDEDSYYYEDDAAKLDLTKPIKLYYYSDSVKLIDFRTFQENLKQENNLSYIIIDSTSLQTELMRGNRQGYDTDFYSVNRSGSFDKNYVLNIKYLMQRYVDDNNNQTSSGSDVMEKQMMVGKALTSILSSPLTGDDTVKFTALVVAQEGVDEAVVAGKTVLQFRIGFVATYFNDIMLHNDIDSYPIDSVKLNNDVIVF
jgi:hypothetical protein